MNDIVDRVKNIASRRQRDLSTPTEDWQQRVKDYHAGIIDDDRVVCDECRKYIGGKCKEKLGSVPNLKRRCIRWAEKKFY